MVVKSNGDLSTAFITAAIKKKIQENFRLQRLNDYYAGRHDILLRHYNDITKPNNKIVVNYCKTITDFLTSYLVGAPVKIEVADTIQELLNYNDNAESMHRVVTNMNTAGFGCELFYADNDGIARFSPIDPRECIFVTNDTIEADLIAFIRLYEAIDEDRSYNVTVYTKTGYTEYSMTAALNQLVPIGEEIAHYWNDVPAIIYPNSQELAGSFEGIISLQDALNKLVSDELNDFESFVDAYLILEGMGATTKEDIAKMKQDRVLLLEGSSKAYWLIKQVNNDHIKDLKTSIVKRIQDMGSIPDMDDLGTFGTSGIALKYKLIQTEIQASKQERAVYKGTQRKLELLYNFVKITKPTIGEYTEAKISFERSFILLDDDKNKRLTTNAMLVTQGLMSRLTFLINSGLTEEEAIEELKRIDEGRENVTVET